MQKDSFDRGIQPDQDKNLLKMPPREVIQAYIINASPVDHKILELASNKSIKLLN